MKIQCPKCRQTVLADQVNMARDLAFCQQCNEGFKVSESIDQDAVNPDVLKNPPKGAWFRKERDQTIIGASTRSPIAFFLVPFTCVWSGFSIGGIYGSQIVHGRFNLGASLFGIPFLLGSIVLVVAVLMSVFGKIEVSISRQSSVFTGIGRIGWTQRFDWSKVRTIREDVMYSNGKQQAAIVMDGEERLTFGAGLSEPRKYFLLNVLKYLKSERR